MKLLMFRGYGISQNDHQISLPMSIEKDAGLLLTFSKMLL